MSLQFIRDGKKETRDVKCFSRDAYQNEIYSKYRDELKKRMWKKLDNNIGYIYPGTLKRDSVEFIMDKLKDTKGIVIDFRCYPSDFPLFELGKFLMPLPTPFVSNLQPEASSLKEVLLPYNRSNECRRYKCKLL